ncbi:MAG: transporter [Ramlibacter sp.]|jgi:predicted RND superfamily exporter protein|nr:transporter [Ramlibacter sp.]
MAAKQPATDFAVVADAADFDRASGNALERALFNHRGWVVLLCALVTLVLAVAATQLRLNASFAKTIPAQHPFILNFLAHEKDIKGLANVVRLVVAAPAGRDIFDRGYLDTLRRLNDEVYLLPGVDRSYMKSLWMPAVRWIASTEDGYEGGPVMPPDYDGSPAALQTLAANVQRSGEIGQLVAPDLKSSVIHVPLLEQTADGAELDYGALSQRLETLRAKYEAEGVRVHITGFAKVMGDLIDGLRAVLAFFAVAVAITAAVLLAFTRCWRSTALVLGCTLVAVVWLLGLLPLLGYTLNPYSVLVPFLVFAIGVSHGAQKMNGIMQDIGRGTHRLVAARHTFRRLFLAGAAALLADVVGFAVLSVIDIPIIRELAVVASLGVALLIFTNLALLPVLLSYTGVSARAAQRSLQAEQAGASAPQRQPLWRFLDLFTRPGPALAAIVMAVLLGVAGFWVSLDLKIGDLDAGAPELRQDSRYNRDNAWVISRYAASSDVFVVMVRTTPGRCADHDTLLRVDALEWQLRQLAEVEGTASFAGLTRRAAVGLNEGSLKWYDLVRNQGLINASASRAPRELFNETCDLLALHAYLRDHKAETLTAVVATVQTFAAANDTPTTKFLLAAGNAGVEAATNIVVKASNLPMLLGVYAAVVLLCALAFRSWRAVVCAVLPLVLTSILAEALMVLLGIGVKVSTLPVIALGVGIGVDYSLYVLSVTLDWLRRGESLSRAYYRALLFTGRVVVFTGVTLSLGVLTWTFSPIKFQADMGLLLVFMFLWNMLGALVLVPALATFLLKPATAGARQPGLAAAAA